MKLFKFIFMTLLVCNLSSEAKKFNENEVFDSQAKCQLYLSKNKKSNNYSCKCYGPVSSNNEPSIGTCLIRKNL